MRFRASYALVIFAVVACGAPASAPTPPTPPSSGLNETSKAEAKPLITVTSAHDFGDTMWRLESAIDALGLKVMAKVDHAANATGVGMKLPPTTLLIFGKPEAGTKLMLEGRTTAIDLPLKMLIWQRDDGSVAVTYDTPEAIVARHGLQEGLPIVAKMRGALDSLAKSATANSQ